MKRGQPPSTNRRNLRPRLRCLLCYVKEEPVTKQACICTGWTKTHLPTLKSIFPQTSDRNLNKLCRHTVARKPLAFLRFCRHQKWQPTAPSSRYSSPNSKFHHLKAQKRPEECSR
ncbi:hypothetical protein L798_07658 [Zootermopsis nevadensis]|uniref:Uncharacterized protein n=1 Tax=Zootermopsis nevadensis TaxID=136037 RepID=A0A067R6V3_ZOONE|nr:hypothetical protein L798_07658 [Zootermopsis nevadensis]